MSLIKMYLMEQNARLTALTVSEKTKQEVGVKILLLRLHQKEKTPQQKQLLI